MDRKLVIETLSMVLLIGSIFVISAGTTSGNAPLWWVGFVAFVVGALLPVWTRFMNHQADKPHDMGMEYDERAS
ncbi:MAG: hypothetical protein J7480_02890 [Microbacteriaceae bacterium]|nr:hypothetical protein [Microbacteriaceae bacterium]